MAVNAAPRNGRSSQSVRRRSVVEEGDGLLEQMSLKGWRWSTMLQLRGGNTWREVRWHGRRGGYAQRTVAWRRRSRVV
jgi:hypothetical protein